MKADPFDSLSRFVEHRYYRNQRPTAPPCPSESPKLYSLELAVPDTQSSELRRTKTRAKPHHHWRIDELVSSRQFYLLRSGVTRGVHCSRGKLGGYTKCEVGLNPNKENLVS
jgi:hypothetical protein